MIKKEVIALSKLNHPGIVRLVDSFPVVDNKRVGSTHKLVVVMEYLRGGELLTYW